MDPWDWCGLDKECKRDCLEPTPCKIPALARKLAEYEDTGMTPEDIKKVQDALNPIPFKRFYEIMEAERDGRCVVLPCKVGDTVYMVFDVPHKEVVEKHVVEITVWTNHDRVEFSDGDCFTIWDKDMKLWDKTVFLTFAEAVAALNAKEEP
jgi:hypothetical protein